MAALVNGSNVTISNEFWEAHVSYYVGVHGMFIIAVIGIVANSLSFLVFGRFKPQTSTTLYLQALALADLISLSWDTIFATALPLLGVKTEAISNWGCKIFIWHDMSSSTVASCALMVVALDRFVALNFGAFHVTRKTALMVSILLWVVTYMYCSPLIYFYELSESGSCAISFEPSKANAGLIFVTFITYGPYFGIPVVGIVVSNVSIVKLLWANKKNRGKIGKAEKEFDDVSWLLVIDSVAFLVLIGITATLWALAWSPPTNDREKTTFQLMFILAQFISVIQESMDFFLYLICSKLFRRSLKQMFGMKNADVAFMMQTSELHKKNQTQMHLSSNTTARRDARFCAAISCFRYE